MSDVCARCDRNQFFLGSPESVSIATGGTAGTLESLLEYDKSKQSRKKNGLIFLLEEQNVERSKPSRLKKFKEFWKR